MFFLLQARCFPPETRRDADGNVYILRKDGKLIEACALGGIEQTEAQIDGLRDGFRSVVLVCSVEGGYPSSSKRWFASAMASQAAHRILANAVAQEAVHQFQELCPLAKSCREIGQRLHVRSKLRLWQSPSEERPRFVRAHGINLLPLCALGDDFAEARRDEPRGVASAFEEGAQILLAPGVIDDEKDTPVAQRLA